MSVSHEFSERVLGRMNAVRPITHRAMFGGIGVYLGGPVFAILDDDRVFFKVDALTRAAYDEAGAECWMYDPKVGPVEKYREVPSDVLAKPETLGEWMDAAAAVAERLATRKKKPGPNA